ncbi:MAG: phosphate/phosphite/phosphonate ABC transporter substrate-binding protein [Chloroflexota bacterium]|nr:phosphate/phosphite/phosphonate ABC transporter substrate-binding protein [Chloroflexota bacterium]MDE3193950.1 phosphate/phosphite/phosphonate ABC transporter substrate-binding protein [Chloroflexota bacterium]
MRPLALALVAASVVACAGIPRQRVSLAQDVGPEPSATIERTPAVAPLRIAVANVVSPKESFRTYQDLIAYVGRRTGRPTELIQRGTYAEINALLRSGNADLAFVCSLAYVQAADERSAELLVTPVIDGRSEYWSDLIVPVASAARSMGDLRGAVFAYTDPLSNSGWLAPAYALWGSGEAPAGFFRRTIYTYSHDNSIRAVADSLVDGAAVDSLVYDNTIARDPDIARRVRVLARFGPFGAPPVVVARGLSAARKAELRSILLGLASDPAGVRILAALRIDRFVTLEDRAYDTVRQMRDALAAAGLFQP